MKSIVYKLMLIISLLIITLLCLLITVNLFFMDDYYIFKTRSLLEKEVETLTIQLQGSTKNLNRDLKELSQNTGYKYTITDREFIIKYSSHELPKKGTPFRLQRYLINEIKNINSKTYYGKILREKDEKSDVTIIEFVNDKYYIIITKPLEQLTESATIANSLIIITGLIILIIGLLLSYLLSKRVVKPILEITEISKEISNLNFSRTFSSSSRDEITDLGNSINSISHKLGSTIEDLKNEMVLQKRFLASVSHELKTPISLIRGYTESLTMDIDDKDRDEFSNIILEESDRLNLLMNELLLLVKMDSTNFKLSRTTFDVIETLSKVLSRYQKKDVKVISPTSLLINADERRMMQVMTNLMDNAFKYCSPDGEIKIKISEESRKINLLLFNNCDLIDPEQLKHLFDPFYSIENSRNRKRTGSGLGLSIVKSIIKRHSGNCNAYYKDFGFYINISMPL